MQDLDSQLFVGSRIDIERTFVGAPDDPRSLVVGYRAALHFTQHQVAPKNRYSTVGEGDTIDAALKDLAENDAVKRRPDRASRTYAGPFYNPPPEPPTSFRYLSSGSWGLQVLNPSNADIKGSFDSGTDWIESGFKVNLSDTGDCVSLEFLGRHSPSGIGILDIVALYVDGKPEFYGAASKLPHPMISATQLFLIKGAKEHLNMTLMDQTNFIGQEMEVSAVVSHIARTAFPPTIAVNDAKIQGGGVKIRDFYMPYRPVKQVLDDLAFKLPNSAWGVDANGEFFFSYRL